MFTRIGVTVCSSRLCVKLPTLLLDYLCTGLLLPLGTEHALVKIPCAEHTELWKILSLKPGVEIPFSDCLHASPAARNRALVTAAFWILPVIIFFDIFLIQNDMCQTMDQTCHLWSDDVGFALIEQEHHKTPTTDDEPIQVKWFSINSSGLLSKIRAKSPTSSYVNRHRLKQNRWFTLAAQQHLLTLSPPSHMYIWSSFLASCPVPRSL